MAATNFMKRQRVVRVISVMGSRTASMATVTSVKKGVVLLDEETSIQYRDADGSEIDPAIPGCSSFICELEGEED